MTAALAVDGVSVAYGEVEALTQCSFTLEPGQVTGLIGMNGSGKSTLFKSIMGVVSPQAGRVQVGGVPAAQARRAQQVAYVPQSEDVDWDFPLSVWDVVMMGRYGRMGPMRRPRKADRVAVSEALERVELGDLAGRQIGALSGGQRKRAFVARGIAQGASLMLLDEPFAGVDKRSERTVVTLLRDLAGEGHTILVSTHDLHALPALADQAILLLRRVLYQGDVAGALEPQNLTRAFGLDLGGPA